MKNLLKVFVSLIPVKSMRRRLRRNLEFSGCYEEQLKAYKFLRENYIEPYLKNELPRFQAVAKKIIGTDKIIWQYWGQGINENVPPVVLKCFNSVKQYMGDDYKIVIITDENIGEYVDIPDFIFQKLRDGNNNFSYALFSDIIRLYLLSAYGGVWIDATILLTGRIEENLLKKDFFAFQRAKKPADYKYWENFNFMYFSWVEGFKINFLNSFIIARKNNFLINTLKDLLVNYWKNEKTVIHYYIFQIMFDSLMKDYGFGAGNCEIVSDVLPHFMQAHLKNRFSKNLWEKCCEISSIHKLTYIKSFPKKSLADFILNSL